MTKKLEKLLLQQEKAQQKIKQADFKLRQQKYYENSKKRKERSHRLIQKGALLEKYFKIEDLSVPETEELLKYFAGYVAANKPAKYFKK